MIREITNYVFGSFKSTTEDNFSIESNIIYEFDKVYGIRKRPSEMICVVKKTGEVIWEENLPEDLLPNEHGKERFIRKR